MGFTPEMRRKSAETRARKKAERATLEVRDAGVRPGGVFAGVGESKIFVASEGAIDREIAITQCHLNGKLIADLNFTPEQLVLIRFRNTDEGIAAFAPDRPVSDFEKELRTYVPPSGEDREMQNWENPDLLGDTAKGYKRPGFAQRFLGERRTKEAGLRRWQPVKDKGELVKAGRMFLAEMPEKLAQQKRAANKAESAAQLREIGDRIQVNQECYVRDGGLFIKPGEILRQGGEAVTQEGVHIRRGNAVE